MYLKKIFYISMFFVVTSCRSDNKVVIPTPSDIRTEWAPLNISEEEYKDKVLGALVGSAIGDGMGASTEMWHRKDIRKKHGFITGLTEHNRDRSPEGPWQHYLPAGSTTDDTRWKYLIGRYAVDHQKQLSPPVFSVFLQNYFESLLAAMDVGSFEKNEKLLDDQIQSIDWIKEWVRVSQAYNSGPEAYLSALNRFYGGEMACGGLLYSPLFGLISPNASEAYDLAYQHALFDLGYAKDITSLSSAITHLVMHSGSLDSLLEESFKIDPHDYTESRLIGRLARSMTREAIEIGKLREIGENPVDSIDRPASYKGSGRSWQELNFIYARLDQIQQRIPFHAGEIWQITVAGLVYGKEDFSKTMEFIVNYGRDNDTTAALAGFILGAKIGFQALPAVEKQITLTISREVIGIDLEKLAEELSSVYYNKIKPTS